MDTQNPTEGEGMTSQINPEPMPEMQNQAPLNNNEGKKFPTVAVVGVIVLIAAIVGAIYYFTPQGWPLDKQEGSSFNIPTEGNQVILFDNGKLYAFDPSTENTTELGSLKNGSEITTANYVAISQNHSHIALAVPNDNGGSDILVFSDFDKYEKVASQSKHLDALSVSDSGAVLFAETSSENSDDSKVYFVSRAISDSVESLGDASVPFFADSGRKIINGTSIGYKVIDLEAGDSLETETPGFPTPANVNISSQNNYLSIMNSDGNIMLYEIISTRPFQLRGDNSYPINSPGVKEVGISSSGQVAFFWNTGLIIVDSLSNNVTTHSPTVSSSAHIIGWNN